MVFVPVFVLVFVLVFVFVLVSVLVLVFVEGSRGRQRPEYLISVIIKDQYSLYWTKISTK